MVCLQGTQMTMETPWTHGQWYVTPVARTAHRAADGVIIAVSLQRFSKESIVTHHVWQPGRLLGVRVKAGQESAEVDTYIACGYAPTEVAPADVREKFWDSVDRMLRSLPRRTRIIMAIDANAMMTGTKETYTWVGKAGSTAKVETQGWNENGRALYRLLRDHHLTAVNTHGAAQKPTWTHIGTQGNHRRIGYIITHVHVNTTATTMECRCPSGRSEGRTTRKSKVGRGSGVEEVPGRERRKDHRSSRRIQLFGAPYSQQCSATLQSETRECKKKPDTILRPHSDMLVRKKQAILKALATARGNTKFLERCRLSAEAREMQRQVKNAVRRERRAAAEALAEKAEIAAAKGDTRELFRLTRKMAPLEGLPTQTVRQCCPNTGALAERCWTQDEELDARTHALEYIFEGAAGESPEIMVDDPKDLFPEATEIPVGPFAAADVVMAVKGLPNYEAGPNIFKNEGEKLASGSTVGGMEILPASSYNCVLANEKGEPSIEDQRDSLFGQGQEGCSRPGEWMEDHQPPSAWRQTNLAKSGSQDI